MNFIDGQLIQRDGQTRFVNERGVDITLTGRHAELVAGRVGQDAVLGIRPEGIFLRPNEFAHNDDQTLDMTVDVVEPLGNTMDMFLSNGSIAGGFGLRK